MPLRFPNLDALTLALTSAAVPTETATAPVAVALEEDGGVVVTPSLPTARKTLSALRPLGVKTVTADGRAFTDLQSWLEIVPLEAVAKSLEIGDKTPVLFDLVDEAADGRLAEVVTEMLRLGNDRQSVRRLETEAGARTLLRVLGPPYYTLLRAIDSPNSNSVRAFYEQRPRIWVELGYRHPLADRIQPAPGKLLLLRSPRVWETLDEAPFQDVYPSIEFVLPPLDSAWRDRPLAARLTTPLRLTNAAETDDSELWVLDDDPISQIEQLTANSDDELIARLAFAVVEQDERTLVLVRVRPSKLPPPVLILRGVACRAYLNLPNLFVPIGRRLHPPLRRDAVMKLLAPNADRLVWLHPAERNEFTPRSIADGAFRPLSQWVDYILDREHEPLAAWTAAHRFQFASFIGEDLVPAGRKDGQPPRAVQPPKDPSRSAPTAPLPLQEPSTEIIVAEAIDLPAPAELTREPTKPSDLQQELTAVEDRFLALASPLDAAERRTLWREMAVLNGRLERSFDATLCWTHSVWEADADPTEWNSWREHSANEKDVLGDERRLQGLLSDDPSLRPTAARLAVQLIHGESLPAERLATAAQVLALHESAMPVRLAWLAWLALARAAHGDALALARARDRILERLFRLGLTPDHDIAGFLRAGSGADADRLRVVRRKFLELRDIVAEWIVEPPSHLARTRAYADLIFAYGLARLGDSAEAERIAGWARQKLSGKETVHRWSLEAFEQRIGEARRGVRGSQLGQELIAIMELMDRTERYKADRLREHSRIIEPFERIDPYRRWHRHYSDDLDRDLAVLFDITDSGDLRSRLSRLLTDPPAEISAAGRAKILTTALALSPRLGGEFAAGLVGRVLPALDPLTDVAERASLLEKALQAAAHFDLREAVQAFVERFEASLPAVIEGYLQLQAEYDPQNKQKLTSIEALFNQSLRGLRKLGLRDEIGRVFNRIVTLVRERSAKPAPKSARTNQDPTRADKLLLAVAGGWFFFGQQDAAMPVVDEVRRRLFQEQLRPPQKAGLVVAYVSAVGQAPLEIALPLVSELFAIDPETKKPRLTGVADSFVTASHFSLAQLDIIEAAVLTLVSDESVLAPETRRLLEEDEYLVRRRIHADVRRMLAESQH